MITMTGPIPREEVEKYQAQAKQEYSVELTYEEAEQMIRETNAESEATDRK